MWCGREHFLLSPTTPRVASQRGTWGKTLTPPAPAWFLLSLSAAAAGPSPRLRWTPLPKVARRIFASAAITSVGKTSAVLPAMECRGGSPKTRWCLRAPPSRRCPGESLRGGGSGALVPRSGGEAGRRHLAAVRQSTPPALVHGGGVRLGQRWCCPACWAAAGGYARRWLVGGLHGGGLLCYWARSGWILPMRSWRCY